jgi:hypothetical protein
MGYERMTGRGSQPGVLLSLRTEIISAIPVPSREQGQMFLQAKAANCFSSTFILRRNGTRIGKYDGRWFSECQDIHLTGRRTLQFRKIGWLGSEFELVTADEEQAIVGHACRSGLFTSSWDLELSIGAARLGRMAFNTMYELVQDRISLARVDREGACRRSWIVDGAGTLQDEDLLLIGLVYQTILQRQRWQE